MTITELVYCVWGGLAVVIALGFTSWVSWKMRGEEDMLAAVLATMLIAVSRLR